MTKSPISVILTAVAIFTCVTSVVYGLGSGATIAVVDQSATVCGIVSGQMTQHIVCYDQNGNNKTLEPTVSFSSIAAGRDFLCGIRSGGSSLFCWNTVGNRKFVPKRIYYNDSVLIENLSVGDFQVCATVIGTGVVTCWRGDNFTRPPSPLNKEGFASVSSGFGFTCGILIGSKLVRCWGSKQIAGRIQTAFGNMKMSSLVSGVSHVCGMNSTGNLVCKGSNEFQQLNIPSNSDMEYSGLALGAKNTCGIRQSNGSVVCWGADIDTESDRNSMEGFCFDSIVAGPKLTCGLTATNFSIKCWGSDRKNLSDSSSGSSFPEFLPGPFISNGPCSGSRNICNRWRNPTPTPPSPPASASPSSSPSPSPSSKLTNGLLAFAIIGSLGTFSGVCSIIYWLWTGVFSGKKKVHNSVQPKITRDGGSKGGSGSSNLTAPSRSLKPRRRSSKLLSIRRQRSGTSMKHPDIAAEFTLAELSAATDNFSSTNKIGAGSFGVVYTGKLPDGSLVAIKRGETRIKRNKLLEKEIAFDSELAFLSRVHHKHLVRLVGFCEEDEERLLVYEYMKNGALYDHLHSKNNVGTQTDSMINSWKTRIKIALDASRGIEYLHNYAVPPIIHRDIKSSNILLSDDWTARVSDFGLSLMYPEKNHEYRDVKAAGTFGYIDPEYYGLNVLTTKSDVYGFGVVLLELLTGRRAIFKDCEDGFGGNPVSIVDYIVPEIMSGELAKVLDSRVGLPDINEAEAVELVAYTAMHCVSYESKDRPTMADIVGNLERAFAICGDDSHGSISSDIIEISCE